MIGTWAPRFSAFGLVLSQTGDGPLLLSSTLFLSLIGLDWPAQGTSIRCKNVSGLLASLTPPKVHWARNKPRDGLGESIKWVDRERGKMELHTINPSSLSAGLDPFLMAAVMDAFSSMVGSGLVVKALLSHLNPDWAGRDIGAVIHQKSRTLAHHPFLGGLPSFSANPCPPENLPITVCIRE